MTEIYLIEATFENIEKYNPINGDYIFVTDTSNFICNGYLLNENESTVFSTMGNPDYIFGRIVKKENCLYGLGTYSFALKNPEIPTILDFYSKITHFISNADFKDYQIKLEF